MILITMAINSTRSIVINIVDTFACDKCEGHATARQYLSSLGLSHCHPFQASITTPIQSRTWLSMAIFPRGQYLSSLRLNYFQP